LRWTQFRKRLRFARSYPSSKHRDFYWHHIFGIWSLLPLVIIVATAVVFSFNWAGEIVSKLSGSEQAVNTQTEFATVQRPASGDQQRLTLDQLLENAMQASEGWQSITIELPEPGSHAVSFKIDRGTGRQPQKQGTLILDAYNADVIDWQPFNELPAARKSRVWIRFLHTGEVFGWVGQTLAGLASLASLFMIWTGLSLAWRRLISPLFSKRQKSREL